MTQKTMFSQWKMPILFLLIRQNNNRQFHQMNETYEHTFEIVKENNL